jgi:FAD/FMN-containing dehydrogenase
LEGTIAGEVILPGSPGYELARKPAIARFHDARPRAVVRCQVPADVAETIAFARRHQVPAAVRSGGHSFAGRSSTAGIVIDVSPMASVSTAGGVATAGGGTCLGALYDTLAGQHVTVAGGCGPTVGVAGLTLGGGLGILGRVHGLTCDQLLAAEVVLADGRVAECDDRREPGLLWALRGAGGGNFGVVTSLTFRTVPAPAATSFHLTWPHRNAVSVVEAWQAWAPAAPAELAASLLLTAAGEAGRPPAVHVFGTMLGAESATTALLAALAARAGADPASLFVQNLPYQETKRYLTRLGDQMREPAEGQQAPEGQQAAEGRPAAEAHDFSKSEFFARPLPADAITALVAGFGRQRPAGQSRELDFTPWAGAYNRPAADATAFPHRDALFLLKHTVSVDPGADAAGREAARRWLDRSWATVHPFGTGGVYPNFPDPGLADEAGAYYGVNLARLLRVKARYDPDGFFPFR